MDHAARDVMGEYPDIVLGFGESDEYRFVAFCYAAARSQETDCPLCFYRSRILTLGSQFSPPKIHKSV